MPLNANNHQLGGSGWESLVRSLSTELFAWNSFPCSPSLSESLFPPSRPSPTPSRSPFLTLHATLGLSPDLLHYLKCLGCESQLEYTPTWCWNICTSPARGRNSVQRTTRHVVGLQELWVDGELVTTKKCRNVGRKHLHIDSLWERDQRGHFLS